MGFPAFPWWPATTLFCRLQGWSAWGNHPLAGSSVDVMAVLCWDPLVPHPSFLFCSAAPVAEKMLVARLGDVQPHWHIPLLCDVKVDCAGRDLLAGVVLQKSLILFGGEFLIHGWPVSPFPHPDLPWVISSRTVAMLTRVRIV